MAAKSIAPNTWYQIKRDVPARTRKPFVSLRKKGVIGFSETFIHMAGIDKCNRASVYLSPDKLNIAFKFHSNEDDEDSFILCRDGGTARSKPNSVGRVINGNSIVQACPTVKRLLRESRSMRTYIPSKDPSGLWVVHLAPSFECTLTSESRLRSSDTGIYRYLLNGDTIYIGRGILLERFKSPERSYWQFDTTEYSVLNNTESELKWESRWLDEYRRKNKRWPIHNSIGGAKTMAEQQEDYSFG